MSYYEGVSDESLSVLLEAQEWKSDRERNVEWIARRISCSTCIGCISRSSCISWMDEPATSHTSRSNRTPCTIRTDRCIIWRDEPTTSHTFRSNRTPGTIRTDRCIRGRGTIRPPLHQRLSRHQRQSQHQRRRRHQTGAHHIRPSHE